ncbi:MAG: right-handed parallel beta-helix repeat-containing protein, partial [Candidatus Neomarinimicrobiota bacterium]
MTRLRKLGLYLLFLSGLGLLTVKAVLLGILTWTESTFEDFADGTTENVIVSPLSGGVVHLPHPMVKVTEDYRDDSSYRFLAYDSSGNFIRTWLSGGNVFVCKYAPDGSSTSETVQANESAGSATEGCRGALRNDGSLIVIWFADSYSAEDDRLAYQVFDPDLMRVGTNAYIDTFTNTGHGMPGVFANNADGSYWILHGVGGWGGMKIYVQRVSLTGTLVGAVFRLNTSDYTVYEHRPRAAVSESDDFVVTWEAGNEPVSNYFDVYCRRFRSDGQPLGAPVKVNDDVGLVEQYQSEVCFDDSLHFLVVWADWRDNTSEYHPYDANIYGQLSSLDGIKIGSNFRVNTPRYEDDREPDVSFREGQFQVSWRSWNNTGRVYETYVNQWKFTPIYSGNYVSSVFDAGAEGTNYTRIYWSEVRPENTTLSFRLRSAPSVDLLRQASWYGPQDAIGSYTLATGENINPVHNGDRYLQYQARLHTKLAGLTPALRSVSITFMPLDSIPPQAPSGVIAEAGHSAVRLTWDANPEGDISAYRIYRGRPSLALLAEVPADQTEYLDTSATTGFEYYYALTAVDYSHNESHQSEIVAATPYGIYLYVDAALPAEVEPQSMTYSTIQAAINAALYGDTVLVLPGTYNTSITMKDGVSLIGSGPQLTYIVGPVGQDWIIYAANHSLIKGFTIAKGNAGFYPGIYCNQTSPRITDNIITNYGATSMSGPGISCLDAAPLIAKNLISMHDMGIHCHGSAPRIKNNIIKCQNGVQSGGWSQTQLVNNTILVTGGDGAGIIFYWGSATSKAINNIVYRLDGPAYNGIIGDTDVAIAYNNSWNFEENYRDISPGLGGISADPLFVNIAKDDYRLSANSPCIDAGHPGTQYLDVDGSQNDMGAFGGPDPIDPQLMSELIRSISMSQFSGFPGDTVRAAVSLDNPVGLMQAIFTISYETAVLSAVDVLPTATTADFTLNSDIAAPGNIEVMLAGPGEIESGEGDIMEIIFVVDSTVQSGMASAIIFNSVALFDGEQQPVRLKEIADGLFIVNLGSEAGNYIYVDARSNEFEDGSRYYPYDTIQEAVASANLGDTVVVASGVYTGPISMNEGVYLKGVGARATVITCSMDEVAVEFNNVSNGEISGFTIRGPELEPAPMPLITCRTSSPRIVRNRIEAPVLAFMYGVECVDNSNPLIEHNAIVNSGIAIWGSSPVIRNNYIEGCDGGMAAIECRDSSAPTILKNRIVGGYAGGAAIRVRGSAPTIVSNRIWCSEGLGTGISLVETWDMMISNNIIEDPGYDGIGISVRYSSNISIINNTINTSGKGIFEVESTITVLNNIVTGNSGFGIQLSPTSSLDYNDVWGNANNYYLTTAGEHDISVDPTFVDSVQGNYRLVAGSP